MKSRSFVAGSVLIVIAVFLAADLVEALRVFSADNPPFLDQCIIDTRVDSSCDLKVPCVAPGGYCVFLLDKPQQAILDGKKLEIENIVAHVVVEVREEGTTEPLYTFAQETKTTGDSTHKERYMPSRGISVAYFSTRPNIKLTITCKTLDGIVWPDSLQFAITDSLLSEKAWRISKWFYRKWYPFLIPITVGLMLGGAFLICLSIRGDRNEDGASFWRSKRGRS